ncbi:MAG: hypothetical protein KatS3mg031_1629 [Chitinophagales bacterium]|nr:MAG: hypothetical protein KatS3mg031_1629 [Chitinophagales bacterium]
MLTPQERQTINEGFRKVQARIYRQFKKNPDLHALLFLIGIRELGQLKSRFTKEEKQYLMHVAVCRLLSQEGYYVFQGLDEDGWPHYAPIRQLPPMHADEQEYLLKKLIIRYFDAL